MVVTDEVRFEIKDGTEYATLHADTFRAAMRERDALRAENEQLKHDHVLFNAQAQTIRGLRAALEGTTEACQELKDENERLKKLYGAAMDGLNQKDAEIKRLQEHLESKAW